MLRDATVLNRVVVIRLIGATEAKRATSPGVLSPVVVWCCTYVEYMYIHCAFPASLRGATYSGKRAPRAKLVSHEKMPPELCTTVIYDTVIRV